jgi:hypothetical protein
MLRHLPGAFLTEMYDKDGAAFFAVCLTSHRTFSLYASLASQSC